MDLAKFEILPFPNSVFYLTGLSLLTLVYATYSKSVSKWPAALNEQMNSVSNKINNAGKSISNAATELYQKSMGPTGPGPVPEAIQQAPLPVPAPAIGPSNNNQPNLNPLAPPEKIGGSKKKRSKRNKNTKRSKR